MVRLWPRWLARELQVQESNSETVLLDVLVVEMTASVSSRLSMIEKRVGELCSGPWNPVSLVQAQ